MRYLQEKSDAEPVSFGGKVCRAATILLFVALSGAGCSDAGNPTIPISGFRTNPHFSEDGRFLIVGYGHHYGAPIYVFTDTVAVYETGTWKKIMEIKSEYPVKLHSTEYFFPFICGEPPVLAIAESVEEEGIFDLVFRTIPEGEEVERIHMDPYFSPQPNPDYKRYFCDLEENLVYLEIFEKKITVLDASTGEQVRHYVVDQPETTAPKFFLQKEKDRLVAVDTYTEQVFVYRLSSGELLGVVNAQHRTNKTTIALRGSLVFDYFALVDEDHLLLTDSIREDDVDSTYLTLVDLEKLVIDNVTRLEGYYSITMTYIEPEKNQVYMSICIRRPHELEIPCYSSIIDYMSGEIVNSMRNNFMGYGTSCPLPHLGILYFDDWTVPAEEAAWVFSYPEFELLHRGPAPMASNDMHWISRGRFIVMKNTQLEQFGVYDPINFEVLDVRHLCEQVTGRMQIDPQERWAAVACGGVNPHDDGYQAGDIPRHAGVAIIDLDRYR